MVDSTRVYGYKEYSRTDLAGEYEMNMKSNQVLLRYTVSHEQK